MSTKTYTMNISDFVGGNVPEGVEGFSITLPRRNGFWHYARRHGHEWQVKRAGGRWQSIGSKDVVITASRDESLYSSDSAPQSMWAIKNGSHYYRETDGEIFPAQRGDATYYDSESEARDAIDRLNDMAGTMLLTYRNIVQIS